MGIQVNVTPTSASDISDRWNLITTLAGAIIGSVVGGALSYFIAKQSMRHAKDIAAQDKYAR